MKQLHDSRQSEIKGAQAQNGKDVRSVDDERVERDGQDGGNWVPRKDEVGGLHQQEHHEQRGGEPAAVSPDEESILFVAVGYRHQSAKEPQHGIPFRVNLLALLPGHLDAGQDQEGPEDVNDPMELLDQGNAGGNKDGPHNQRAQDAPEKDLVLVGGRHAKVGEEHQEDENVIYT